VSFPIQDINIPISFLGGLYDKDAKLIKFGYRDYDPNTGKWITKDPIKFDGGDINLYNYVINDPVNGVDPWGLHWEYSQSTGQLTHVDDATGQRTSEANGYSGTNRNGLNGRNNPDAQGIRDNGPIPQGEWNIGALTNTTNLQNALPLTPRVGTDTFGRTDFRIHGEGTRRQGDSSNGCPIFPLEIRQRINNSGDNTLRVVP
jgi:RHS repeat-associated protein